MRAGKRLRSAFRGVSRGTRHGCGTGRRRNDPRGAAGGSTPTSNRRPESPDRGRVGLATAPTSSIISSSPLSRSRATDTTLSHPPEVPMMRSRLAAIAMVASAGVTFAAVGVVSGTRHDELEPALGPQAPEPPGSRFNERVAMPRRLVGLELALGLLDAEPTDWEGDVSVSAGELLDVAVLESGARAEARGAHFAVATSKATPAKKQQAKKQQAKKQQAKKQQAKAAQAGPIVPVTMRVNLVAPADATVTVTTGRGKFSASLADLKRGGRTTFLGGQAALERV